MLTTLTILMGMNMQLLFFSHPHLMIKRGHKIVGKRGCIWEGWQEERKGNSQRMDKVYFYKLCHIFKNKALRATKGSARLLLFMLTLTRQVQKSSSEGWSEVTVVETETSGYSLLCSLALPLVKLQALMVQFAFRTLFARASSLLCCYAAQLLQRREVYQTDYSYKAFSSLERPFSNVAFPFL